jgi:glutamyl-Q tRNA(Asp) synthetase
MSSNAYVGRFAPSPSGPLHAGSLVAALASFLDARVHGGRWLLRIEDIDETRTVPGAAEDIVATLAALDMHSDGPILVQSQRKARYQLACEKLGAQRRRGPLSRDLPPRAGAGQDSAHPAATGA